MEDSICLFLSFDFKNDSLIISNDDRFLETTYSSISTRESSEIAEKITESVLGIVNNYQKYVRTK